MSDLSSQNQGLDLRMVDDPGVRQALRSMQQHFSEKLKAQQAQIDAMLDLLIEKNFTSLGELKREVAKIQQNAQRAERLHQALFAPPSTTAPPAPAPGMHAAVK